MRRGDVFATLALMSTEVRAGGMSADNGSVELVGVTKRFGTVTAVDALDVQVRPGEFLSLLGLRLRQDHDARMLAGFEDPDEGEIRISGTAVQGMPPHKRDVNTVFQNYALFPHMSVAENVAYGLRQKRRDKAEMGRRVGEALEMVKMSSSRTASRGRCRAVSNNASRWRGRW